VSLLINLWFGTVNYINGSMEIGYYMRMKGRGNERYIIANGNSIEPKKVNKIINKNRRYKQHE